MLLFTYVFRHALAWFVQKEGVTIYICVSVCTGMVGSEGGCYHLHVCFGMNWHGWFRRRVLPFTYVFRHALAWLVQKEDVTIYICVSACTVTWLAEGGVTISVCVSALAWLVQKEGVTISICVSGMVGSEGGCYCVSWLVDSEGGCYHLHMCFGMHWHGWFRRRVLLFTYVFRHALTWLVQKEGVAIYICVSACTDMVGSEGGCYYLHMCFGMHWHGWFRRRVLPFTYVFRHALAWLVQKEGSEGGWFRRRVLPFTYVFRHALAWLVQKEGVTIYICFRHALAWLVQKEGATISMGMHWHGWLRRRVLPFTYVFRHALAWLVQKEGVTIYICVSVCTGMVGSEGGCYHLHMCFGMHWHGWCRRRVLPFTYVFRHALAWLIQKEDVTIYICVSACTDMVQKEDVTIYICVSVCTGMVGSEGGCYHLHMCFGMDWHGWFRRRVLPFTYVFRHALAWLVQKEGVTIYICVSACTGMVGSEGGCYYLHMCFGMHWHGWFRRRVLLFTYVFRYALAWLVQKEGVTIYICFSACTGMVGSEGGFYHLYMCFGMHWYG